MIYVVYVTPLPATTPGFGCVTGCGYVTILLVALHWLLSPHVRLHTTFVVDSLRCGSLRCSATVITLLWLLLVRCCWLRYVVVVTLRWIWIRYILRLFYTTFIAFTLPRCCLRLHLYLRYILDLQFWITLFPFTTLISLRYVYDFSIHTTTGYRTLPRFTRLHWLRLRWITFYPLDSFTFTFCCWLHFTFYVGFAGSGCRFTTFTLVDFAVALPTTTFGCYTALLRFRVTTPHVRCGCVYVDFPVRCRGCWLLFTLVRCWLPPCGCSFRCGCVGYLPVTLRWLFSYVYRYHTLRCVYTFGYVTHARLPFCWITLPLHRYVHFTLVGYVGYPIYGLVAFCHAHRFTTLRYYIAFLPCRLPHTRLPLPPAVTFALLLDLHRITVHILRSHALRVGLVDFYVYGWLLRSHTAPVGYVALHTCGCGWLRLLRLPALVTRLHVTLLRWLPRLLPPHFAAFATCHTTHARTHRTRTVVPPRARWLRLRLHHGYTHLDCVAVVAGSGYVAVVLPVPRWLVTRCHHVLPLHGCLPTLPVRFYHHRFYILDLPFALPFTLPFAGCIFTFVYVLPFTCVAFYHVRSCGCFLPRLRICPLFYLYLYHPVTFVWLRWILHVVCILPFAVTYATLRGFWLRITPVTVLILPTVVAALLRLQLRLVTLCVTLVDFTLHTHVTVAVTLHHVYVPLDWLPLRYMILPVTFCYRYILLRIYGYLYHVLRLHVVVIYLFYCPFTPDFPSCHMPTLPFPFCRSSFAVYVYTPPRLVAFAFYTHGLPRLVAAHGCVAATLQVAALRLHFTFAAVTILPRFGRLVTLRLRLRLRSRLHHTVVGLRYHVLLVGSTV